MAGVPRGKATAEKGREFAEAVLTHAARYLTTILGMADRFPQY